jgi:hypothetical protein
VTRAFEHLNPTLNASPAQITLGLRRVMLAIWASQVGLTLIAAIIARFVIAPRDPLGFTQVFLAVSLVLYLLVSAFTRVQMTQAKNLATAFQTSMLLGAVSTVPGVLACVLIALEGLRIGSLLLGLASLGLLGVCLEWWDWWHKSKWYKWSNLRSLKASARAASLNDPTGRRSTVRASKAQLTPIRRLKVAVSRVLREQSSASRTLFLSIFTRPSSGASNHEDSVNGGSSLLFGPIPDLHSCPLPSGLTDHLCLEGWDAWHYSFVRCKPDLWFGQGRG